MRALVEKRFVSLQCSELRPQGFSEGQPLHLCEPLSCEAIVFNVEFVRGWRDNGTENSAAMPG